MAEPSEEQSLTSKELRRRKELAETFRVLDACLAGYYQGRSQMYRALAGQLRILLADSKPLLSRVFPSFGIGRLKAIEFFPVEDLELFDGEDVRLRLRHPPGQVFKAARMPVIITEYSNGLQVADLDLEKRAVSLNDWMNQTILRFPVTITIRDVVKGVADKGGGAHVDDELTPELSRLSRFGPTNIKAHHFLIVAVSRLMHVAGTRYLQLVHDQGIEFDGSTDLPPSDPEHPVSKEAARIPETCFEGKMHRYRSAMVLRVE